MATNNKKTPKVGRPKKTEPGFIDNNINKLNQTKGEDKKPNP